MNKDDDMLTDIELKEKLIAQINETKDHELLNQISRLIELESQIEDVYQLSPDELKAVNEGIDQIDNGQSFTYDEANKIIDKCLGR
ncbi:MAG TPA: hypothetical protein VHA56_07025 [Mucilaginibacter sp.]|nr:hypothetical protein [Mucilaginibacter sp.]